MLPLISLLLLTLIGAVAWLGIKIQRIEKFVIEEEKRRRDAPENMDDDELFERAKDEAIKAGKASTSLLQRRIPPPSLSGGQDA